MKKFLLIIGMIMAVMMVVQPCYASTGNSFNIIITVASFSMEMQTVDGDKPYTEWFIGTVSPGSAITMTAMDAVKISLDANGEEIDIFTFVEESGTWNALLPPSIGQPLTDNSFVLDVGVSDIKPISEGDIASAMSQPMAITYLDGQPVETLDTSNGEDKVWLVYRILTAPHYDDTHAEIEIRIDAKVVPPTP